MFEEHQRQLKRMAEDGASDSDSEDSNFGTESDGDEDEWEGFAEPPAVDYEAEYIDEDEYTTVTVEEMDLSKDALYRQGHDDSDQPSEEESPKVNANSTATPGKKKSTPNKDKAKKKKKRFRYETKEERKLTQVKQRLSKRKKANARER